MRRKVHQWAFQGDELLWNPARRIIGQVSLLHWHTPQHLFIHKRSDKLLFDVCPCCADILHTVDMQEGDLFQRTVQRPRAAGKPAARLCLHTGAFLFHYKGSTIPPNADREKWHMPDEKAAKAPAKAAKAPAKAVKAPAKARRQTQTAKPPHG